MIKADPGSLDAWGAHWLRPPAYCGV